MPPSPTAGARRGADVLILLVQSLIQSQMFPNLVIAQIQKKIVSSFRFKNNKKPHAEHPPLMSFLDV